MDLYAVDPTKFNVFEASRDAVNQRAEGAIEAAQMATPLTK
jgi:hypothetical protein